MSLLWRLAASGPDRGYSGERMCWRNLLAADGLMCMAKRVFGRL